MGISAIVHGYIECPGYGGLDETKRVSRYNRRVLRDLPASDPEWPFITKSMFSMTPLRSSFERGVPQYECQLIHFAGDYKNMLVMDADWLRKFEDILSNLCWYRAVVLTEFCTCRYEWNVSFDHYGDRYRSNPPRPPTKWSFQCFEVSTMPVRADQAIEGSFESRYHRRIGDVQ